MLSYLLQADPVEAVQAAPVQQEMSYSLIEMATKGGWLMIVLLVLSVILDHNAHNVVTGGNSSRFNGLDSS